MCVGVCESFSVIIEKYMFRSRVECCDVDAHLPYIQAAKLFTSIMIKLLEDCTQDLSNQFYRENEVKNRL